MYSDEEAGSIGEHFKMGALDSGRIDYKMPAVLNNTL